MVANQYTLAEGIHLLTQGEEPDISDLVTYKHHTVVMDISFAVVHEDGEPGFSVIIASCASDDVEPPEDDGDPPPWNFSRVILPRPGESLVDLSVRIAKELGIDPQERIWEDADAYHANRLPGA